VLDFEIDETLIVVIALIMFSIHFLFPSQLTTVFLAVAVLIILVVGLAHLFLKYREK